MNLKFIETFVWVARLKSFRLAAAKTYSTAAAVSARISTLEEDLDIKLFYRNSKSVTLTEQGEIALSYAESMVQIKESLRKAISDNKERHPTLRVGALDTVVSTWLNLFTSNIKAENPKYSVEILIDSAEALERKLIESSIDVIFNAKSISNPKCCSEKIASYRMWQIAPSDYVWDGKEPATDQGNLITLTEYDESIRAEPINNGLHKRISKANSAGTLLAMVQGGFGIGIVPSAIAINSITNGSLVEMKCPALPEMEIFLSWREGDAHIDMSEIMTSARKSVKEYAHTLGDGHISLI